MELKTLIHTKEQTKNQTTDMRAEAAAQDEKQQIVRIVSQVLAEALVREGILYRVATEVVEGLRQQGHRGTVYIPAGGKQARDAAIKAAFTGNNLREVCEQFNVTKSTVYRACSRR